MRGAPTNRHADSSPRPLRSSIGAFLAMALVAGPITAQTLGVGYRDLKLANTGNGSPVLQTRVFYPATKTAANAPLIQRQGGWPACVFLHGYNKFGQQYAELGFELASHGYLAFMSDTAPKDLALQVQDGLALHAAIGKLDKDAQSFLFGQIRADRLALLGHSSGASNVAHVLAANPGYVCGVAYGPYRGSKLDYTKNAAAKVRVPMLVIGGAGEKITPWKPHVLGFYDELTAPLPLKEMLLLDDYANHYNIIAWVQSNDPRDHAVFDATHRSVRGFLAAAIDGDLSALDPALGLAARKEKRVKEIRLDVDDPLLFRTGPTKIGRTSDFQLAARPGPVVWLFALRPVRIPTVWGFLGLDPGNVGILGTTNTSQTAFQVVRLTIPRDPNLKGLTFFFQTAAQGRTGTRFSSLAVLPIAR